MRTAQYSRYLDRMKAITGADTLAASEETAFLQYFQRNIRYAWESFNWPELCPTEERSPDGDGIVALEGGGESDIGEVFEVYDADPDSSASFSTLGWILTPDGIRIVAYAGTDPVFVSFRQRIPEYEGDDYDNAATYAADDQVYYSTTGKFYKAVSAGTAHLPTDEGYWQELEIPYVLFEFVVQSSYADSLLAEGFNEKAGQERAKAEAWLIAEYDKLSRQQRHNFSRSVVRTHGSTQFRRT